MAKDDRNEQSDAPDSRRNEPRRGLEGTGFDAGAGREGGADGASIPRGTDEHSDDAANRDRSAGGGERDPRGVDLDAPLGGERRDPGR